MVVALVSVLENSTEHFFNIVVVGKFKDQQIIKKITDSLAKYNNARISLKEFDFELMQAFPIIAHYSLDIYTRLWVQNFFDDSVERVIYLDSDLIVTGNIAELLEIDLEGYILGAVNIPWFSRTNLPNFRPEYGYFNSGVIVFNLKEWRQQDCENRIMAFIRQYANILVDPDQDALNDCFFDKYKALPHEWNLIRPYYLKPDYLVNNVYPLFNGQTIDQIVSAEKLIHYNGAVKPWSYLDNHPRKQVYYAYLKLTAWHDFVPVDQNISNAVKKTLSLILPKPIKQLLKKIIVTIQHVIKAIPK
jgi:lipopolysaccharide biosynthesis glycosyltransferase